jgi:penicillin-binding protein 2
MYKSIVASCDTYYYMVANDLGVDTIHDEMQRFGFGEVTGIDIAGEAKGLLPSTAWKRSAYKRPEQQKWYAGETISLGIGQGYNSFTILQLATAIGTLANDGIRMKPHLVKEVDDLVSKQVEPVAPQLVNKLTVKPEYLEVVHRAMVGVNVEGTAAAAFRGAGYTSGGKTGTAQVIGIKQGEKYNAAQLDERHRDHALFIAYAPAENPTVAVAMVVENGGFGAAAAAPIARRIFDFLLMGQYPSAEDIAAVQQAKATTPIGTPRPADAAWPPAGSNGAAGVPATPASAAQMASAGSATRAASAPVVASAKAASSAKAAALAASAPALPSPPAISALAGIHPAFVQAVLAANPALAAPAQPVALPAAPPASAPR